MINNIKEYFPKVVQKRGLEYYNVGKIKDVFKDGNYYHSNVMGEYCYHTVIEVEDNQIVGGHCDCLSFSNSNACKHMAGLCYYVNNNKVKEGLSLDKVLDSLTREELLVILKRLLLNRRNKDYVSFNYIDKLDEVIPAVKYYLDYLVKKDLVNNNEYLERLLDILLKLASINLARSYVVLEIILSRLGSSFKKEALRFIDISSIYYTPSTSISLIYRLLEIDYLKLDIITILIKNNKTSMLKDILEYLDKKSLESIKDKLVKLRILSLYDKKLALEYARDNLSLDKEFLKCYVSLSKDPGEVLLTYLENYNSDFNISKEDLIEEIKKTNNSDYIEKMNLFL